MVQNSRASVIVWNILLRLLLFIVVIIVGFFPPLQLYLFINEGLGYVSPGGFFGFDFSDWEVTWIIAWTFWSGLIFGMLGKKIDYFIILFFVLFALYDFSTPTPVNPNLYILLVSTIVSSNVIGFALKLARQKFLPGWRV
jgi:hypothetical protein